MVLESYLKEGPFRLTFARDGQEALNRYWGGEFDLILMDMQMPILDGLSATRALREEERKRGLRPVPVIALTASARPEDIRNSASAGCNGQISKPVSKQKLVQTLQEYLEAKTADRECHYESRDEQLIERDLGEERSDGEGMVVPDTTDMPEELQQCIPDYLRTVKGYASEMSSLLASNDFDKIRSMAHNIKGTGGSYGLPALTNLAAAVENSAKKADAGQLNGGLSELAGFLDRVFVRE